MTSDTEKLLPIADEATRLLKALAHPARLIICCHLRDVEMSVGDIEINLGIKQPRLSRELAKLREENIVDTRRESKVVYYKLSSESRVRSLVDAICATMLNDPVNGVDISVAAENPNHSGSFAIFARLDD